VGTSRDLTHARSAALSSRAVGGFRFKSGSGIGRVRRGGGPVRGSARPIGRGVAPAAGQAVWSPDLCHPPGQGPLLPRERHDSTRAFLGRGAAGHRRHPPAFLCQGPISDDRPAPRLGREQDRDRGVDPATGGYADYNNFFYARHGFAVVNYTSRGEGASCGGGGMPGSQNQTGVCARGFVRVADQRFDARDAQYLPGLLVDQGIADPGGLGVSGWSYGGGRSFELAYLNDRIRCAGAYDSFKHDPCRGKRDGALIPWRSPGGRPLSIAAAWPRSGSRTCPTRSSPTVGFWTTTHPPMVGTGARAAIARFASRCGRVWEWRREQGV
jgi:hypothetical protein